MCIKTTDEHFDWFQESVHKWMDRLYLHGWDVFFEHKTEDALAISWFDGRKRTVTISFCIEWIDGYELSRETIDMTAKHEAVRILLWPLAGLALMLANQEGMVLSGEILKEYTDITLRIRELI